MKHVISLHRKAVKHEHRQRGASLLEGIAYLGIAAIVVIGAVALMRGAFSNAQSNSLLQDVVSIRTNVRKLFMGQGGYTNVANGTLIAARGFPDGVTTNAAAATATNTWGGAIALAPANNNSQFTISYAAVPQDVCVNALSGATGWIQIVVNNRPAVPNNAPITPAQAAAECNAANNAIIWTAS